jgi:O-antigen/teichoic acid export membrane protein
MSPTWLLQGLERMALAAFLEVSSKVAALGAILRFVHSPSDEGKVLAFHRLAPVVTMLVGFWMTHRLLTLYLPSLILSIAAFAGAHVIVRIVFGRTFELALHPFITSLLDEIGSQSLLLAGKEVIVTKAVVAGGLLNLAFAFVLAPRFLGKGMAVSVVLAEAAADFDGFPPALLDVPRRINE